jgi:hypothetical protein
MIHKIVCLITAVIFGSAIVHCQTIYYGYDTNGNRTSRVLVTEQLKSAKINFPVTEPEKLALTRDQKEDITDMESGIRIYPNPTSGILKVEILNLPNGAKTDLKIYNLSGLELINRQDLPSVFELDISRLKDGIYILRIAINETGANWKIIKNTQ